MENPAEDGNHELYNAGKTGRSLESSVDCLSAYIPSKRIDLFIFEATIPHNENCYQRMYDADDEQFRHLTNLTMHPKSGLEKLIRFILRRDDAPAIIIIRGLLAWNPLMCQCNDAMVTSIARHYGVPSIDMRASLYPAANFRHRYGNAWALMRKLNISVANARLIENLAIGQVKHPENGYLKIGRNTDGTQSFVPNHTYLRSKYLNWTKDWGLIVPEPTIDELVQRSLRDAAVIDMDATAQRFPGWAISDGVHPRSKLGQEVLSDLLIATLRDVFIALQIKDYSHSVYGRRIPESLSTFANDSTTFACFGFDNLVPMMPIARSHKWYVTNSSGMGNEANIDASKFKPGIATTSSEAWLEMTFGTELWAGDRAGMPYIKLGFRKARDMGIANVSCAGACSCNTLQIDALGKLFNARQADEILQMNSIRESGKCRLRIEVLNQTSSETHNFKLLTMSLGRIYH